MASFLVKLSRPLLLVPLLGLLGGCSTVVMSPAGDVAIQERNLILASTGLMLLIIIPVIAATGLFAWRYREGNTSATYLPNWNHSTSLEVLIWTAPLLIIIALGALTWISTHVLDPFRPVERIDTSRRIEIGTPPLVIEVVALDWKWLFLYPEQGIATVNELAAPIDRPIQFKITSATVMNTFFVPTLAGQIYAMAGMETQLSAVINHEGVFDGFSGNYSGAGFSDMKFKFHGLSETGFDQWISQAKGADRVLDIPRFQELQKPSEGVRPQFYGSVDATLYDKILNLCTDPGKMCMDRMMTIDAAGGGGKESEANRAKLKYDGARTSEGNEAPGATFPASGRPPNTNVAPQGMKPTPLTPDVNQQKPGQQQGGSGEPSPAQGQPAKGMPGMDMPGMNMPPAKTSPAPKQLNEN